MAIYLYILIFNVGLFVLSPVYLFAQKDHTDTVYREAVDLARKGKSKESILLFKEILAVQPGNEKVLMDYLVVLSWAGRCSESVEIYENLKEDIPVYVLNAAAKCYRDLKLFDRSIKTYKRLLGKKPDYSDALLGLAYSHADNMQGMEALKILEPLIASHPEYLGALFVKGYVYEKMGEYIKAYQQYENIIERYPDNKRAWRLKINALSAIGAHQVALETALAHKDHVDSKLITRLRNNIAAEYIRWGKIIPPSSPEERWYETDKAIDILSGELAKDPENLRAGYDRMVGWLDRLEIEKVIEEYEKLKASGILFPVWVKAVAADAYMYLKRPDEAVMIYSEILKDIPDDYSSRLALFYGEITLNHFDKAEIIINQLITEEESPTVINRGIPDINWRKVEVETARIWLMAYRDRLAEAEKGFKILLDNAPFNSSIHSGLAHMYLWRGWPRKALREFQWILNHDPEYVEVRVGYTNTLMEIGDYREAEQEVKYLTSQYPYDLKIKGLDKRWRMHNKNRIRVDSYYNREERGGKDRSMDISLTTRPFLYDFRFNVALLRRQSDADSTNYTYSRLITGIVYDGKYNSSLTQEIGFDIDSQSNFGSITGIVYRPDDYWSLEGAYNTFSLDVPLRARTIGITARSLDLGITYQPDDRRDISFGTGFVGFSDGNNRFIYSLNYKYKLIPGSSYSNHLKLNISGSTNSMKDRAYFNPSGDISYSVTDINKWVTHNQSDQRFKQNLSVTIGGYHQADFDPGITAQVKYTHQWEFSMGKELVYSIALNRRIFDGEAEYEPAFNISLVHYF